MVSIELLYRLDNQCLLKLIQSRFFYESGLKDVSPMPIEGSGRTQDCREPQGCSLG